MAIGALAFRTIRSRVTDSNTDQRASDTSDASLASVAGVIGPGALRIGLGLGLGLGHLRHIGGGV